MVLLKKQSDSRPVFLNLFQIQLPVCALVSILHRITGVLIVILLPYLLFLLFEVATETFWFDRALIPVFLRRFFEISVTWVIVCHVLAGIRHMWHDFSGVHSLQSTVITAYVVLCCWFAWIVLTIYRVMI